MKCKCAVAVFFALLAVCAAVAQTTPLDSTMLIRVERAALRTNPSFAAPVLAFAAYRTPFAVIRRIDNWVYGYVQGSRQPGYVHISALSPATLPLGVEASSSPPALQESEIVLAGKGFSSSLEAALKGDSAFNFQAVDDMVGLTYSYADCLAFIQGGDLSSGAP
jgi:hypothetical protein